MIIKNIFNAKTVLVTGHTGFKGTWLTLWLKSMGAKVVGISSDIPTNPSHFEISGLEEGIKHVILDVANHTKVREVVCDVQPDFVFHLAAQALVRPSYEDPFQTIFSNAMGTASILESLRSLKKPVTAVMITSDKAYDNLEWMWGYRETDRLGGKDPYSASKGMAELAIRSYVESFFKGEGCNVRLGIARAGNVIGGGDWAVDRIVPDCVRSWAEGKEVEIRNPFATRPWQHVLEPLSGYLSLAVKLSQESTLNGEAFNFGPPAEQNYPVGDLVECMTRHWEKAKWVDKSSEIKGPYESGLLKLNCDKALHLLDWRAVWDFDETVKQTATWYRDYYENPSSNISQLSYDQIARYVTSANEKNLWWSKHS